jgi:hypothetical protein
MIVNILANGYKGDVHLVNPKRGEILGRKVRRASLRDPELPRRMQGGDDGSVKDESGF